MEVAAIPAEEIYSKKISCGKRTYFFNLKEQDSGTRFIDIKESRYDRDRDRHQKVRIFIFEDHIDEFVEALQHTAEKLKTLE